MASAVAHSRALTPWTTHESLRKPHVLAPITSSSIPRLGDGQVAIAKGKRSLLAVQAQARFVRLLDVPAGLEVCLIGARKPFLHHAVLWFSRNGKQCMPSGTIVSRRAIKQWSGVAVPAVPAATLQQGGGVAEEEKSVLLRPSPAEGARTVTESCSEGTLSTVSEEGWPLGTEVRFAVDMQGNPVLRLMPGATHSLHLGSDSRCSLHVQLEQPGRRKPQCTLQGFIRKVEDEKLKEMLEIAWERRFAAEHSVGEDLYIMDVEQVLQSPDKGEEEIWVPGSDYWAATADPLRDCAKRIVEDMNRNHWEDIRRFCNVYANLDVEPGFLPNYSTQQIAITGTTLRPKYKQLKRTGIGQILPGVSCCKSVIDSGSPAGTTSDDKTPDAKADGRVQDGSVLTGDGSELRSTLRLVECAMLAATAGLAYFLSNLLRIEAYFGCFFPLPVVISSMRWGPAAGRKTMVATAMLLLILSGPLKAASYLLMHGFVGLAMGAFWKWNLNWGLSIAVCTVVRCLGALGFVLMTSWLLRDNLLALITMNAHASLSYMLAALGINLVPTIPMIYVVFATLLVVNCGSFVFLLHVLYAIFLRRLGLRGSITVPGGGSFGSFASTEAIARKFV